MLIVVKDIPISFFKKYPQELECFFLLNQDGQKVLRLSYRDNDLVNFLNKKRFIDESDYNNSRIVLVSKLFQLGGVASYEGFPKLSSLLIDHWDGLLRDYLKV